MVRLTAMRTIDQAAHHAPDNDAHGQLRRPTELDELTREISLRLRRYGDADIESLWRSLLCLRERLANGRRGRFDAPLSRAQIESFQQSEGRRTADDVSTPPRRIEELEIAIGRLPLRQREILRLHLHDDLTYEQIAREKRLTCHIVRRTLRRAYLALCQHMPVEQP